MSNEPSVCDVPPLIPGKPWYLSVDHDRKLFKNYSNVFSPTSYVTDDTWARTGRDAKKRVLALIKILCPNAAEVAMIRTENGDLSLENGSNWDIHVVCHFVQQFNKRRL